MKKILLVIVTIVMVMSFGITVFADETITEKNGKEGISVHAKTVYVSPDNMYEAIVVNGKASVTLSNNEVINISTNDTALDGRILNVIDIVENDNDAYSWIAGIMNGLCDKFTAYDIYFNDLDGRRISVTGEVEVSITTPDGYSDIQVYHIGSSANPEKITSKQSDGNTVFTATTFSYYVLANKETDNSSATNSSSSSSVQTGDASNIAFWLVLLLISGGAITAFGVTRKCKKSDRK